MRSTHAWFPIVFSVLGCSRCPSGTPSETAQPATAVGTTVAVGAGSAAPATAVAPAVPALPETWPALPPGAEPRRTEDGIPVIQVRAATSGREGSVEWISSSENTLEFPRQEASDGARIYFAIRREYQRYSDVLVRDGVVYENVIAGLARTAEHPGGCAAASMGNVILTAPVEAPGGRRAQVVWRLGADGAISRLEVPPTVGSDADCWALLDPDGAFALGIFRIATWDGSDFQEDRGWFSGRTVMGSARGRRYCFQHCNAAEAEQTDPATATLKEALGCGSDGNWIAWSDRVAGICRDGSRAVRMREGGAPETIDDLPRGRNQFARDIAFSDRGDLVVALDYGFARYVVWPADGGRISPERSLARGEALAHASPTVLVTGLGSTVPPAEVSAITLGASVGFGSNGPTVVYSNVERSSEAHVAQVARARAVLPATARSLVVAHEAVVDVDCGTYVRSPIGWESMQIMDWAPPELPPLSPRAVTPSPSCVRLAQVSALPGDPDLLLGRSPEGELLLAWLPPPLPLPTGTSHWDPGPPRPPAPQNPRPGTGWSRVARVDAIRGVDGVPAPGADTAIEGGSWQVAGGAILATSGREVLLTRHGAVTLPAGTTAMALDPYGLHAWGALGNRLVVCAETCRIVDPGVGAAITAVVPRTRDRVILGFADGRVGAYVVPAAGGEPVPQDPLVGALVDFLRRKPTE